jgi:hypothetical protein
VVGLDDLLAPVAANRRRILSPMIDPFGDSKTVVPLDDEFDGWVFEHPELGTCIQHPLYYSVPHHPELNDHANKSLAVKREAVERARTEQRWSKWLVMHERPWRFQALGEIEELLGDEEYWQLLAHAWIDSENIWQNESEWLEKLQVERGHADLMMEEEDRQQLESMPELITIYRGYQRPDRQRAISWTLELERAEWFARRWLVDQTPLVATGTVAKRDVIALLHGRDEAEVLVKPDKVEIIEVREIEPEAEE